MFFGIFLRILYNFLKEGQSSGKNDFIVFKSSLDPIPKAYFFKKKRKFLPSSFFLAD